MFWLLVGSLLVVLVSSVRSSYRTSRGSDNAWPLLTEPQSELICSEETKESPEEYQEPSLENAEEGCQEAVQSLVGV